MKRDAMTLLKMLYVAQVEDALDAQVIAREKQRLMNFIDGSTRLDYVSSSKPKDMPQLVPHLIYDDVGSAIDWLQKAFGFIERTEFRHTSADGRIEHAAMQLGRAPSDPLVMVGPPSVHGKSPRVGVSISLYVYVKDVDRHYEQALATGATITLELKKEPWGDRRYQVADPEGHQWQFAERCPIANR